MSEKKNGGPAFPMVVTEYSTYSELREVTSIGGMTLRDYFIAHAPAEPQSWFEPTISPEEPKPTWRVDGLEETFDDYGKAAKAARGSPKFVHESTKHRMIKEANEDERKAWFKEYAKQTLLQWPAAWADEMLKQRQS